MATIEIEVGVAQEIATTFTAKLRGLTPLLMHRPGSMQAATGEVKRTSERRIPTPEEECETSVYRDKDGILYAPSRWVMRAMTEAGKQFSNPQNKRQTMMKMLAAMLVPPPVEGFPLFLPTGEVIREYEIDIQRVVVQRNAVMRARQSDLGELGALLCEVLKVAGSKQG